MKVKLKFDLNYHTYLRKYILLRVSPIISYTSTSLI